jgi:RES domain-containing protein
MIIYRLANSLYKDDFYGEGARMFGGRWNSKGNPMLYATEHISLAVLEVLVNKRTSELYQCSFNLIKMEVSPNDVRTISKDALKESWENDMEYSRFIGDQFLKDPEIWILKVPSTVIDEEHNFLINPFHKEFRKLEIVDNRVYNFNYRLIGNSQ